MEQRFHSITLINRRLKEGSTKLPVEEPTLKLDEIRSDEFSEIQETAYANDLARLHARIDEFVDVDCPACGENAPEYKFERYKCKFNECGNCSALYMSPRPSLDVMDEYYSLSENYAAWNKYIFPKSEASRREKICRPNLERVVAECQTQNMDKPALLEIGPGFGTFSELARKSGYFRQVTVVERNPEMADACKKRGLNVIEKSLEELGEEYANSVDVAVCFEVIEHVYEPLDFVQNIHRQLRPNGVFAFTCPNGKGFDTIMLGAEAPAIDTEHVNLFNPRSITTLMGRAGFSVVAVETPGQLDVELVKRAIDAGFSTADKYPFWSSIFGEDYARLAGPFQHFLASNGLAGNMRVIAQKISDLD